MRVVDKTRKESFKRTAKWGDRFLGSVWLYVLVLATMSIGIAFLLSPYPVKEIPRYRVGDVAYGNIKAKQAFLVEDKKSTEEKRKEAAESVPAVYDYDPALVTKISERVPQSFAVMRKFFSIPANREKKAQVTTDAAGTAGADISGPTGEKIEAAKEKFNIILGIDINPDSFRVLIQSDFSEDFETLILELLNSVMYKAILANKNLLLSARSRGIIVRNIQNKLEMKVMEFGSYLSLDEEEEKSDQER